MERASLHVTRSFLFNFVGERKRNGQNRESILVISVFLPRFNATSRHYYYRIRIFLRNLSLEIQSLLFIFVDFIKRKPP